MAHKLKGLLALAVAGAISMAYGAGGLSDGPSEGEHVIPRDGIHDYDFRFDGGYRARVVVKGDGDSDLDLSVRDRNNSLICDDDGLTDLAVCEWTPRYSGRYAVRVRNYGMANRYRIMTN
ncbi:MAG: hypothetical protein ACXWVG_19735 [Telluria sp.]